MPRRALLAAAVLVWAAFAGGAMAASSAPPAKLAAVVLGSADFDGAKPTEQGFVPDVAAASAYERDFESVEYGRSRLLYVESRLMLYASPLNATVARTGIGAVVDPAGSSFKSLLTLAVAHFSGLPLKSYAVRRTGAITLPGTDGRELVLRLVTPLGRVDEAYVFMQTGKLVGTLTVMSAPNSSLEHADLARLYRTFATRMRAGSRRLG